MAKDKKPEQVKEVRTPPTHKEVKVGKLVFSFMGSSPIVVKLDDDGYYCLLNHPDAIILRDLLTQFLDNHLN